MDKKHSLQETYGLWVCTGVMEYKETGICPDGALCEFSDKYEKITVKEKYVPKTPGLSLILKDPYYIKSERVVLKDE